MDVDWNEVGKTLIGMLIVGITLIPLTVMMLTGVIGAGLSAYFADYTTLAFYIILVLVGMGIGWYIYQSKLQMAVLGGITALLLVGVVFTIFGWTGLALGLLYGQFGVIVASIVILVLLFLTYYFGNLFALSTFWKMGG